MISIYCGKVEDLLGSFRPDFFDACLCDPPYGLKFMGKSWDHGVPSAAIWKQVKRTLKPGAPILAFGGTRTFHRLAVAIEDAGFEVFDSVLGSVWIYGQGFPKSLDIGKAIDKAAGAERPEIGEGPYASRRPRPGAGATIHMPSAAPLTGPATEHARAWHGYGTALKPAWEPIVCARKPLAGTYAANCIEHGVGGLNIDGSRIAGSKPDTTRGEGGKHGRYGPLGAQGRIVDDRRGRFPSNLILSHHPECEDSAPCHPDCPVRLLDEQSGVTKDGTAVRRNVGHSRKSSGSSFTVGGSRDKEMTKDVSYGGSGGASRFFYRAKCSPSERKKGMPNNTPCDHPTLKPIDLCRYLATLILPPARNNQHRNILIPFSGAGSEIIGATIAGWESITAIEKEDSYVEQAWYRIKSHTGVEPVIFDW